MLADRADQVARMLYPHGKEANGEWEVGSVDGEAGSSLKIRLRGSKAGVWCDFATGDEKGDMLDLWAAAKRLDLGPAIKEAKQYLGVVETQYLPAKRTYAKPVKDGIRALKPKSKVMTYLTEVRKLTPDTIKQFLVSEKDDMIVFPFIASGEKEAIRIKYLGVYRDADGKKITFSSKDSAPCLFGWQAISPNVRSVAITEGEIDAMTVTQYGTSALSVPNGAGLGHKNDWIDYEWENLERFDTIYLCYDNDDAGNKAVSEVAARLGIHRCRIVTFPYKDANECLQKGVDGGGIAKAFQETRSIQPKEICPTTDYTPKVIEYLHPSSEREIGFAPGIFSSNVVFRPGEVTLWSGISSHGKSRLLSQLMLWACLSDYRVAIASMEMRPWKTLGGMQRQFWAKELPTIAEIKDAQEWLSGRIWVYDLFGNVATKTLLDLMLYSKCRHGVDQFVIDSLMKCQIGGDDFDAQKNLLNDLSGFAARYGVHVHIVAHARKSESESHPPGMMDIKGSGDIINQPDNIIVVFRNKAKEADLPGSTGYDKQPDTVVICNKQRESGWIGRFNLWFEKKSGQFMPLNHMDEREEYQFWKRAGLNCEGELPL